MKIILLFSTIFISAQQLRFCALPNNTQSIKSAEQISDYYKLVQAHFTGKKSKDIVRDTNIFSPFIYLENDNLVAFLTIDLKQCYNQIEKKALPYLNIYMVTVMQNYRGKGIAKKLVLDSVKFLEKLYSLPKETIIALHLSPEDICMPAAGSAYYKIGFKKGVFSSIGPLEYQHKIHTLMEKSIDICLAADNPNSVFGKGHFFLTFCKLEDLGVNQEIDSSKIYEKTKLLFSILKKRQKNNI